MSLRRADVDVTQIGGELREQCSHIGSCFIRSNNAIYAECVAKMPNSAFSPECRVPENAERCRLGLDLAGLADRALGIISGSTGRLGISEAHPVAGSEPACRLVVSF